MLGNRPGGLRAEPSHAAELGIFVCEAKKFTVVESAIRRAERQISVDVPASWRSQKEWQLLLNHSGELK